MTAGRAAAAIAAPSAGEPEGEGDRGVPLAGMALFIGIAGFWALHALTRGVEHLGGDQHLILTFMVREAHPDLFSRDLIVAQAGFLARYAPLYTGFLSWAYGLTGDLASGYRLLVFPVTLVYLLGAYRLFREISGSRWAAVPVAAFSSLPTMVPLADEFFGVGPVDWMVARTIFAGLFPFLLSLGFRWRDDPRRLLCLALGVGLLASLYPVSPCYTAGLLIAVVLLSGPPRARRWRTAAGMAVMALVGAMPALWSQWRAAVERGQTDAGAEAVVRQVASEYLGYVAYPPHTLAMLPGPVVHVVTLGLLAASAAVGYRVLVHGTPLAGRGVRLLALGCIAYLLFPEGKLLVAVAATLLLLPQREDGGTAPESFACGICLTLFWITVTELLLIGLGPLDRPTLFVALLRGSQFAVFGLFLLLALSVRRTDWSRAGSWSRVLCLVLVVVAMVWQVRHTVRTHLRTRGDAAAAEVAAVARWAQRETSPLDLFLFDSAAFRLLARRALVWTAKDHGPVLFIGARQAAAWLERARTLRAAGHDPQALLAVGRRYGADYVVLPAGAVTAAQRSRVRYAGERYAVLSVAGPDP
jgi:hypothetical protein